MAGADDCPNAPEALLWLVRANSLFVVGGCYLALSSDHWRQRVGYAHGEAETDLLEDLLDA